VERGVPRGARICDASGELGPDASGATTHSAESRSVTFRMTFVWTAGLEAVRSQYVEDA
jgi:hypothetical protein